MNPLTLLAQVEIDTGDTAWMLVATALVLLMTPALGLFYAGLVRSKNTLNTFMMSVAALAVATVVWALVGYSLAFDGTGDLIGGFHNAFLNDVGFAPRDGTTIPHLVFFAFQATFCIITTALVSGAVVERMRFGAFLVFAGLWSLLVYSVLAHWGFGGGWLFEGGTLDFAGGIAVEMASGFSALAAALVVGARRDYGRQALLPHNAIYVLVGAGLLWFGWFGFNGGSGFNTGNNSVLAFTNTLLTPACTLMVWFILDLVFGRKVTAIGAATAIIVGCVLITPAGGFISPAGRCSLGAVGALALLFRDRRTGREPGLTRRLTCLRPTVSPASRGSCPSASSRRPAGTGSQTARSTATSTSSSTRSLAVVVTPLYAFGMTYLLLRVIGAFMPLRATPKEEAIGMDVVQHGEEAYLTGEGAILVTTEAGVAEKLPVAQP